MAALGTKVGFDSGLSSIYATLKTNSAPSAPVLTAPVAGKTIFNNRPRILVTIGADVDGHVQTPSSAGYSSSSAGTLSPGKKVVLRRTAALTEEGLQGIALSATDTLGLASGVVSRSFSYASAVWTDASLLPNTTPIKAVHMQELRNAVDQVRAYYGMVTYPWAETLVTGVTPLAGWTSHVLEIRTAMEQVVSLVNGWDLESSTHNISLPTWISISVSKPTVAVMVQLRDAILLL